MGRATILSGGSGGLYTIEQRFALPGQDAELADLQTKKTALDARIAVAKKVLAAKELEVQEAAMMLDAMIKDWQYRLAAGLDPDPPVDSTQDPADPAPPVDSTQDPADPAGTNPVPNAASACVAAHNTERAAKGLGSLSSHPALTDAAQDFAEWLADNIGYGHTGPGGNSSSDRIYAAGYPRGTWTGENQASGQDSVDAVMQAWLNSPPHRANLLRPEFDEIGVGYAYRPLGASRHYWVVNFGGPLP